MTLRTTLVAVALCFSASVAFGAAGCFRGEPLPHVARVPAFALRDQNARQLSPAQLRGSVWIANFMFTSCPDVCPFLTAKMSGVRTQLAPVRDQLRFVSFSVDPEHDTPDVLKQYAQKHSADQPDWSFVTGPLDQVKRVVIEGFKQSLQLTPDESGKANAIMHGSHFVLVDRELDIRGFYPSDEEGLLRLQRDARILVAEKEEAVAVMITTYSLASVCAFFNTTSAVLMALGFAAIKRRNFDVHKRYMLSAFTSSCCFLAVYLTRIAMFGDKHFEGGGALRVFYLALLASHVLLALAVAPMVITTLTFGLRNRHPRHEKLARVTLPLWAYVSVTGVIVYLMLYHFPS